MVFIDLVSSAGAAALISSITSLVTWALKSKKKQQQQENEIKIALQALYSNEIRKKGRKYVVRGFVTADEYADLQQMNTIYKTKLDGNGYTKKIMQKIETLPVVEDNDYIKGVNYGTE